MVCHSLQNRPPPAKKGLGLSLKQSLSSSFENLLSSALSRRKGGKEKEKENAPTLSPNGNGGFSLRPSSGNPNSVQNRSLSPSPSESGLGFRSGSVSGATDAGFAASRMRTSSLNAGFSPASPPLAPGSSSLSKVSPSASIEENISFPEQVNSVRAAAAAAAARAKSAAAALAAAVAVGDSVSPSAVIASRQRSSSQNSATTSVPTVAPSPEIFVDGSAVHSEPPKAPDLASEALDTFPENLPPPPATAPQAPLKPLATLASRRRAQINAAESSASTPTRGWRQALFNSVAASSRRPVAPLAPALASFPPVARPLLTRRASLIRLAESHHAAVRQRWYDAISAVILQVRSEHEAARLVLDKRARVDEMEKALEVAWQPLTDTPEAQWDLDAMATLAAEGRTCGVVCAKVFGPFSLTPRCL